MKTTFRFLVAVAMMLTVSLSANAQFQSELETNRFHLGGHVGLSFSSMVGDMGEAKAAVLPTAGVHLDFQIASVPLFLGTGLSFVQEGNKPYSETFKRPTLRLPVVVGYHITAARKVFVSPYAGGFAGVWLGGGDLQGCRDFNYGLRFGCGVNYGRLTFDLGYDLGLFDMMEGGGNTHTSDILFTVGYNFIGDR